MPECAQQKFHLKDCNCTYDCSRKGKCCDCLTYHRGLAEFPACFFSAKAERTYDRSLAALVRDREG